MSDGQPQFFIVGKAPNQRRIAFRRRAPVRSGAPGVVWLSGYRSDMESTKATALDAEAERRGLGLLRFDYSGHGRSEGRLEDGTISRWLEETLALVRAESEGPQIVVGSSMGGYLALLAARALNEAGETERIKGLDSHRAGGRLHRSADLGARRRTRRGARSWRKAHGGGRPPIRASPIASPAALIEDGRKHLLLGGMIRTRAPTVVLQGMRDEDVPFSHALALMQRLGGDPATLTLDQGRRPPPLAPAGPCSSCSTRWEGWRRARGRAPLIVSLLPPSGIRDHSHVAPKRCRLAPWTLSQTSARSVPGCRRRASFQNSGE